MKLLKKVIITFFQFKLTLHKLTCANLTAFACTKRTTYGRSISKFRYHIATHSPCEELFFVEFAQLQYILSNHISNCLTCDQCLEN